MCQPDDEAIAEAPGLLDVADVVAYGQRDAPGPDSSQLTNRLQAATSLCGKIEPSTNSKLPADHGPLLQIFGAPGRSQNRPATLGTAIGPGQAMSYRHCLDNLAASARALAGRLTPT
jgi:hypothetical protein